MDQERDSFEYNTGTFRGLPKYSCMECPVYFFHTEGEPKMLAHCRKNNHGRVKDGAVTIESFMAQAEPLRDVIITLGYLCWNTCEASTEGALALVEECTRLEQLGARVHIYIMDNGSQDGTTRSIIGALKEIPDNFLMSLNTENRGISFARNRIIDHAIEMKSDYVLLMDGDIEIVPLSAYTMARYLECHQDLGCIGAYSSNYTKDRKSAAKRLIEIPEYAVKSDINCAWTQYGMFRVTMFEAGICFDEGGPFGQPGWGFEDDDLCFQMLSAGWKNKYFGGMKYLHRNIRSSWPNLRNDGVDPVVMFKKRKEYLIKKWREKGFDPGKIQAVVGQQIPT